MLRSPHIFSSRSCGCWRWKLQQYGEKTLSRRSKIHFQCSSIKDERGISREARIREEVISPFRSLRLFLYPALMASATIAALTALPRLIAALANSPNATVENNASLGQVLEGLGIDVAAIVVFALLYRSDTKARDLQLAKLSREESLASLRVELGNKRVATLEQMRGSARFVIIAGPKSHVDQALELSLPFQEQLLERGVTLVPFVTPPAASTEESQSSSFQAQKSQAKDDDSAAAARRWIVLPIYTSEWTKWLSEQKKIANIPEDKPVYLSLRMDGRVRGSGVGFPPWSALVAQLPPVSGMWRGALDGMDGRV
ncbi:protein LOW PSII ACCUMULATION 1, chloroplastic [Selaginella moellendorffii]|uniref:protein LOW PSII ACCUMULATION 1, chloroplastic n=1 Tax=Selaginella moellendorffii TaxID=88036 RepID=UPI000D1CFD90|nr:protein LOW PSII ACCUMULATION 1, chloroplastic [Selaginella moellendorffii]|eukprot:XP_002987350.2 protein LOW PSII ACCUMULATION 1, chloroplastic [Selaginella moellendorffii]